MNEKLVKRARTVGGPLLFALGLALLFGHVAGCARQKAFFTGSDGDRQVPGQKTTPLEEPPPFQSVPWIWTYTHSETATAHIPHEVPVCSTDFQLDGDCPTRNARCYFGLHIYTCLPEGKILTYEGRVVDERGNPPQSIVPFEAATFLDRVVINTYSSEDISEVIFLDNTPEVHYRPVGRPLAPTSNFSKADSLFVVHAVVNCRPYA